MTAELRLQILRLLLRRKALTGEQLSHRHDTISVAEIRWRPPPVRSDVVRFTELQLRTTTQVVALSCNGARHTRRLGTSLVTVVTC